MFLDGAFLNVFLNVCFLEVMFWYVLKCMFCVFYVFRASMLFISTVMRYVFQITKTAGDPENTYQHSRHSRMDGRFWCSYRSRSAVRGFRTVLSLAVNRMDSLDSDSVL